MNSSQRVILIMLLLHTGAQLVWAIIYSHLTPAPWLFLITCVAVVGMGGVLAWVYDSA